MLESIVNALCERYHLQSVRSDSNGLLVLVPCESNYYCFLDNDEIEVVYEAEVAGWTEVIERVSISLSNPDMFSLVDDLLGKP